MLKILILFSLMPAFALKMPRTAGEILKHTESEDWRPAKQEDLLYFQLPNGRVIIEMAPWVAPAHVERIKSLAKEKFWDGLDVARVQDGYVVQWMDPNYDKPERKKFKGFDQAMPPEFDASQDAAKAAFTRLQDEDTYAQETGFVQGFAVGRDRKEKRSWLLHCYGSVGVGRDNGPKSGNGTELYAVIGGSPRHLDRNTTVFGRVIQGMEHLSSLPRGHGEMGFYDKEKGEKPIKIVSIRLGSEVPEKERVNLEVLRTDTKIFERWVEARRNREEEWFVRKANRIDACNLSIPVREAAAK